MTLIAITSICSPAGTTQLKNKGETTLCLTWSSFSLPQLAELPTDSADDPWQMEEEEVERRRDIRQSHLVFSIDPKGCEDVDDTLSLR